jgi:hypothetical protein
MALGPGKYDRACSEARKRTGAHTVVLIVVGGVAGNGFSVQSHDPLVQTRLPSVLREIADDIEEQTPP